MAKQKMEVTENQLRQFNIMLDALQKITQYQSPEKLKKDSEKDWGLEYEEALEYAYEGVKSEAKYAIRGIKSIPFNP